MNRQDEKRRDAALVEQGINGSKKALEELVGYYHGPVYNIAYRMLGDPELSKDATQNTFLHAFDRLDSFNPEFKFFSWLYRIAVNESIDELKKRDRFAPEETSTDLSPNAEETVSNLETGKLIQRVLLDLSEDYRTVITLRHFSGLSYDEISQVLSIPVKTVRSRLYSARQLLKDHLLDCGYQF